MKTLNDVRRYAKEKGMGERTIERLISEIETDVITDELFEEICFGIDCECE